MNFKQRGENAMQNLLVYFLPFKQKIEKQSSFFNIWFIQKNKFTACFCNLPH